jgi:hypothetical protein
MHQYKVFISTLAMLRNCLGVIPIMSQTCKKIKVVSREGLVFEQESSLIGKKIRSTNKVVLYPDQNRIETEVIEGDGKGSKTSTIFSAANDTTQIKVEGDLRLGRLERLFSKAVKSTAESLFSKAESCSMKM